MSISTTAYADGFRCIGAACEDTCCVGWKIPVDLADLERYRSLPASPLKSQIIAAIEPAPAQAAASRPDAPLSSTPPAMMRMKEDGRCPMFTDDRRCTIHAQLGEDFLPGVCASFPRVQRQLGPVTETALALSCPEAARLVLLGKTLLSRSQRSASLLSSALPTQSNSSGSPSDAPPWYAEIRSTTLALITSRNLPIWERLYCLCLLCHRLDSIESGQIRDDIPDYLAAVRSSATPGAHAAQIKSLPFDPEAQLDAVLRLSGLMLHRSTVTPRFAQCIAAFTSGIGNGPAANLATLTAGYSSAYRRWFAPFERRNPHILENYLINLVVLHRFPFGLPTDPPSDEPTNGRAFVRLTAQFALTRGLLIGVAGHHRELFSPDHAVHTVQAISRHFEHHPEFLTSAQTLLAESRLDGIAGLSILLRNTPPRPSLPIAPSIPASIPAYFDAGLPRPPTEPVVPGPPAGDRAPRSQ